MKRYNSIQIGDTAVVTHHVTAQDIEKFVDLTGDDNKLHVNEEFAGRTEFKKPVVHGMLGASFISTLIGTKLPGDGALWFSQTLEFLRPVRIGDTISVQAEVIGKNDKAQVIELKTEIVNQNRQIVTTGTSKIKVIETDVEKEERKVPLDYSDKFVLILGSTGGIGKATALCLAEDGFNILLHYHSNTSEANSLKKTIEQKGRMAKLIKADLLNPNDCHNLLETTQRYSDDLLGLVNCTTVSIPNIKFENLEWSDIQKHIDINVRASFEILKGILPIFINNKLGKIVFLTTQAIEQPSAEWLHYITGKSALNGFVKSLAFEMASKGININMVSPSMIDTKLVSEIPKRFKMLTEAKTPLRRLGEVEDVAQAISFLISEKASFITGETIRVNGGQVMI